MAAVAAVAAVAAASCGGHRTGGQRESLSSSSTATLQPRDVFSVAAQLGLPAGLEEQRRALAEGIVRAHAIVEEFAARNGWSAQVRVPLFRSAEVFERQELLFARVLDLNALPAETPLPTSGLAAAIEKGVLLAVTQAAYRSVRPEYADRPEAWERLLAHEMVHELHLRLVEGNSDAMGPTWFFEGFAAFGAGQDLGDPSTEPRSLAEAAAMIAGPQRGSYARYKAVVAYMADRFGPDVLTKRAAEGTLEALLQP